MIIISMIREMLKTIVSVVSRVVKTLFNKGYLKCQNSRLIRWGSFG